MSETRIFERPLPNGYREELRALVAERPPDARSRFGSVLLFQVGALRLALPTRVAAGVAPVLHIARVPHRSGTVLLGLVAFGGEILPCCSLQRILDLEKSPQHTGMARTLVLEESPGRRWALPIDAMLGVRTQQGEVNTAPAPIAAHWLKGSFNDESGMFHLLDADVLFRQITLATA